MIWQMTKITILNTRAIEQQEATERIFREKGFDVINFPCIEIISVPESLSGLTDLNKTNPEVYIFTSQNAVNHAYKIFPDLQIPCSAKVIAVGSKTAQKLSQFYDGDIVIPKGQNSEGVIQLLKNIEGVSTIALITGKSGRTEIQHYASEKGIKLLQINVYQRGLPDADALQIQNLQSTKDFYILATSTSILENIEELLADTLGQELFNRIVICVSPRVEEFAKKKGYKSIIQSHSASPEAIADILIHNHFRTTDTFVG